MTAAQHAAWVTRVTALLLNKRIVDVRFMSSADMEAHDWDAGPVAIAEAIHAQMTERIAPKTMIRAEWFADGTPATCTCGQSPDCDHVRNAQALGTVRGSVSAVWEETRNCTF